MIKQTIFQIFWFLMILHLSQAILKCIKEITIIISIALFSYAQGVLQSCTTTVKINIYKFTTIS